MTDGWYNKCERPRFGPRSSDKEEEQGSVSPVVVVTPVRHPSEALTMRPKGHGLYTIQVQNIRKMSK